MPRNVLVAVMLVAALCARVSAQTVDSPDALLARGLQSYRAANHTAAVQDLDAAAKGFLSPANLERYVSSGTFAPLPELETSLVYLALAHFRLGREEAARETIQRLLAAERIAPTYAALQLANDAADFESIAAALVPESNLPRNVQLASEDPSRPLPAVKRATDAMDTSPAQRQRVAEALAMRVEAPERPVVLTPMQSAQGASDAMTSLRQAQDVANSGDLVRATAMYAQIASDASAPREVIAQAAVGLYRVGAYRDAATAFRRLGTFARGEEDLRYYFAVALYESGEYVAAQKELSCALPFIESTDEVLRYRWKIENTAAVMAMK